MKKFILILSAFLLWSSPALAGPLRDYSTTGIAAVGQGLDILSTVRFYANGSGCTEHNLSHRDVDGSYRVGKAIAIKGGMVVASAGLLWLARKSHNRIAVHIAEAENLFVGARGGWSAARNVAHCGL